MGPGFLLVSVANTVYLDLRMCFRTDNGNP